MNILSIILFPIKHTVLRCIKFKNSTGYKMPQDASGMSQVNSPGVEHQIPDIGMTERHAENYKLKRQNKKPERQKKTKTKQKQKTTPNAMTETFPSQKP